MDNVQDIQFLTWKQIRLFIGKINDVREREEMTRRMNQRRQQAAGGFN